MDGHHFSENYGNAIITNMLSGMILNCTVFVNTFKIIRSIGRRIHCIACKSIILNNASRCSSRASRLSKSRFPEAFFHATALRHRFSDLSCPAQSSTTCWSCHIPTSFKGILQSFCFRTGISPSPLPLQHRPMPPRKTSGFGSSAVALRYSTIISSLSR